MSAEQPSRLSTSVHQKSTVLDQNDTTNVLPNVSDDFFEQLIDKDFKSIKEDNIEEWCEQVLFNSTIDQQSNEDKELQDDFIDELYKCTTTTDQLQNNETTNCFTRNDKIPTDLNSNHLITDLKNQTDFVKKESNQNRAKNEFYRIEDHDYLRPITLNCSTPDRPLNSIDKFILLNENNAFQNSNLDLYVN